jgi:hypothetical protein
MKVVWYVQMHARKDLMDSSLKMDMALVMSLGILKNMRGNIPYITWSFLPLFMH